MCLPDDSWWVSTFTWVYWPFCEGNAKEKIRKYHLAHFSQDMIYFYLTEKRIHSMGLEPSRLPGRTCHILRGHHCVSLLLCTFRTDELFCQRLSTILPLFSAHRLCWFFPLCSDTCSSPSCHNSNCLLATAPSLLQSLDCNTHCPPCLLSVPPPLSSGKCPAVAGYSFPLVGCSPAAVSWTQPWHRLKDVLAVEGTRDMWGRITRGHSCCWQLPSWYHLFLDPRDPRISLRSCFLNFSMASCISYEQCFTPSILILHIFLLQIPLLCPQLPCTNGCNPHLRLQPSTMHRTSCRYTTAISHSATSTLNSQPSLQIWFFSAISRFHKWYHPLPEPETWKSFSTLHSPSSATRPLSLLRIRNAPSREGKRFFFSMSAPKDWKQIPVVYCWEDW